MKHLDVLIGLELLVWPGLCEPVVVHGQGLLLLSGVQGPGGDGGAAVPEPGDGQQDRKSLPG